MEHLTLVQQCFKDRLGIPPERVSPETVLTELGVDSLALLDLMFEVEDKLGVRFSEDTPTPKTVADLLELVKTLDIAKAS